MEMRDLRQRLREMGFESVPPEVIRFAEEHGHIPRAERNWRGFRLFTDAHVTAMAAWLSKRQPGNVGV